MIQEHTRPDHAALDISVDRLSLLLICIILLSPTWGLAAAEWMPRLDLLGMTVVVAWASSMLVVTRAWRPRTMHMLMVVYGIVWVSIVAISFMPDKVYGWTWLDSVRQLIVRLGEHIYLWGEVVGTGGVGKDNTIFLLFLTALFWLITYVGVWNTVRRRSMWWAIAPAGIVLLINMYYYGGAQSLFWTLMVYLFGVLLYVARLYTLNQEQRWNLGRVRFDPEIKRDFLVIGTGIAMAVVLFGAVAPNVAGAPQLSNLWREVSRPVRSIEDSFNRLFAGLQPHGVPYANPFGRTLALLGQRDLGNEVVMEVRAPEGHYWQGVVYDEYTGSAFQSSETDRVSVDPNSSPAPLQFEERQYITQTIVSYFPNNSLVFAAAQPIVLNRAAWMETYPETSGSDASMWLLIDALSEGDQYQVVSAINMATVDELRAANQAYPEAIRARYLQLPPSLPLRVRELARKIVADAKSNNAYDDAVALETWLRQHIKYNDQIPAPGPRQDGVDYLLFEVKEGFCDYYASAMAVMARSIGLPARIVTGYTSGEFDSKQNLYVVRQYNAHTWVEIYFPKYGWIQFEPTASQPTIERPTADEANSNASGKQQNSNDAQGANPREPPEKLHEDIGPLPSGIPYQSTSSSPLATLAAILFGVTAAMTLAAGAVWFGIRTYENGGEARQVSTGGAWAFARLVRMSRWLRLRLSAADTPYEQAKTIGVVVTKRREEIDQLADLYVHERYGRAEVDLTRTRSIWKHIHWSVWRTGATRRLPRWLSARQMWLKRLRR